jgi:phospholipase/lecithinase/hemolysin
MRYILSCLFFFFSSFVSATTLNKFVVFGDSLSDNGNLYEYMKHQLPISPPYYEGRFTNGPVWIEKLAEHYYGDLLNEHLFDYAFAGSGVSESEEEEDDDFEAGALFNLKREVDSYLLSHHEKAEQETLFVIWMGSNNYIALPDDPEKTVLAVNDGIQKEIERLVARGGKHFMLLTVPDLGRTPGAVEFDSVSFLTDLTNQHNAMIKSRFDQLQTKYPDVEWIFFDVNQIFLSALNHPEEYGFYNTTDTCYESAMVQPSSKTVLRMAASIHPKMNANPHACDGYLFFDIIHPTARAHAYIADEAYRLLEGANVRFN